MYGKATISGPLMSGGAALPFTGLSFSLLWLLLAAFALMSAGGALLRVAPSLHRAPDTLGTRSRRPRR